MDQYCYMSEEDVEKYLLSGSRANKNRRGRYEQGKQKIIKSKNELEKFVERSIRERGIEEFAVYGKVSDKLAESTLSISQGEVNIFGKYLELSSNDLWHTFHNHEIAKQPGNIDLSFEELIYALDNLNSASVERVIRRENGRQILELSMETGDGKIILIEVISKSAGSICLKTGWKVNLEKYNKIYKKVV